MTSIPFSLLYPSQLNNNIIMIATYRVLQSSLAFKANFTISTNTGRTTHSNLFPPFITFIVDDDEDDGWVLMMDDDSVNSFAGCCGGGDELGVIIWIRFAFLPTLWLTFDFSVCLLHKFKFCECSMWVKRQSSWCWLVAGRIFFHCFKSKRILLLFYYHEQVLEIKAIKRKCFGDDGQKNKIMTLRLSSKACRELEREEFLL